MPADVEVRMESPFVVAYEDEALFPHGNGEKITRRGDLLLPAGQEPTPVEDFLEFLLINRVGLVVLAKQPCLLTKYRMLELPTPYPMQTG